MLVAVVSVQGSAPRSPGTAMLVWADGAQGSIGGGTLEWRMMTRARKWLDRWRRHRHPNAAPPAPKTTSTALEGEIITVMLGPDVGQCCGGSVQMLLRPLSTADIPALKRARATGVWMVPAPHSAAPPASTPAAIPVLLHEQTVRVVVFGAGHVGQALAALAPALPLAMRVCDSRPDQRARLSTQAETAENVTITSLPRPQHWPRWLAPFHAAIITTHSHELDYHMLRACLSAPTLAYIGVIGSHTKAARFRQRAARDNAGDSAPPSGSRLFMPMGSRGSPDKLPAIIAINTLTEMFQTVHATAIHETIAHNPTARNQPT